MQTSDRIPPQSLDAEMAAIGSMLVDREALDIVLDIAAPSDFYAHAHELLVATIATLHAQNKPIDKISLAEALRNRGVLERVGGLPYLNSIMGRRADCRVGRILREDRRREVAAARAHRSGAVRSRAAGFDGEADVDDAIAKAESAFRRGRWIADPTGPAVRSFTTRWWTTSALYSIARGNTIESEAVLTPFAALNRMIGPSMPGDLNIWARCGEVG